MDFCLDWKMKIIRLLNREEIKFLLDAENILCKVLERQCGYNMSIVFWKNKIIEELQNNIVNENNYKKLLEKYPCYWNNYYYLKSILEMDDFDFYSVFDKDGLKIKDFSRKYFLYHLDKFEGWMICNQREVKKIKYKLRDWENKWEKKRLKYPYINDILVQLSLIIGCVDYKNIDELFRAENTIGKSREDFEFFQGVAYGIKFGLASYGFRFDKDKR